MDALAHPMDSIFQKQPGGEGATWHQNLVAALLSTSGGIGGAAVDARGNRVMVEERKRRGSEELELVVRRLDRFGVERDASPLVVARRLPPNAATSPKVGLGPEGHFVVTWQDTGANAILARRYAPIGAPLGPAFQVNTSDTEVPRLNPLVAVNSTGAFIVLWEHAWTSIRARLFNSSGTPLGQEIDVYLTQHLRQ